jgi:Leucine-rich repeat (LRR) protein
MQRPAPFRQENFGNYNQFTALSIYIASLPDDTECLDFRSCRIKVLPCILKFQNLQTLYLDDNELVYLPPFPASLKRIFCSKNSLRALPPLPKLLTVLDCSKNPRLTTLPLYSSITYIITENTRININKYGGMSKVMYDLTQTNN